ncbi:MAG TPA: efflux RND transporter periplasmic adaptor subunit [Bacillota bacterium]
MRLSRRRRDRRRFNPTLSGSTARRPFYRILLGFTFHRALLGFAALAVLAALTVLAAGCTPSPGRDQAPGDGEGEEGPAAGTVPVLVATAERVDLSADLRLTGTLEPDRSAPLVSLTGGRVAGVDAEEGSTVSAGQVIVRLDAGSLAAQLNQAEAAYNLAVAGLEQARIQLEQAQQHYNRVQAFMERGQATRYDVEDAGFQLRLARHQAEVVAPSQVEQARAARDALRQQYQETRITAPIAGVLARVDVDLGSPVAAGQPVGLVVDASRMRLVVPVSELHIGRFRPGASVTVTVTAAGVEQSAEVAYVPALPAEGRRSYDVELVLANPEGALKAGMTAEVVVPLEQRQAAVAVPVDALVDQGDATFVYVLEGGRALRRPVEAGIVDGDLVEIVSGLNPGETVVVTGQENLYDGARVRPVGDGGR